MSWTFCDSRTIKKTRKDHKCQICGRVIPAGSPNIYYWGGMYDGEFQHSYTCHWCETYIDEFIYDGELLDFWDCIREDIFPELYEKYKTCECGWSVDDRSEGDYLVFECDSCKKLLHKEYMPVIERND